MRHSPTDLHWVSQLGLVPDEEIRLGCADALGQKGLRADTTDEGEQV